MNEMTDRINRLRERADAPHPEPWLPETPSEFIGGVVTNIQMLNTKFGPCPVVTIRDDAGVEKSVWLTHTVLRNEFHRQRVMPGETVLIRYEGPRQPDGGGAPYEVYKVLVDRAETPFDWDQLGPVDGAVGPTGTGGSSQERYNPADDPDDIPF